LKESGDKLDTADRQKVEEGVTAVKSALGGDNPDEIKKSMETLTEAVYAATTRIYQKMQAEQTAQQQGAQPGGSDGPSSAEPEKKTDDNVVNADYKVKDE
ncbi:MAG: molecular chaperone DnaK, partial [Methanoregula sp.]